MPRLSPEPRELRAWAWFVLWTALGAAATLRDRPACAAQNSMPGRAATPAS
jgi:hypothetical protein